MLRSMMDLTEYDVLSSDDEKGSMKTFLFDDGKWTTRYLVVDTGTWLPGRKALVSPMAVDDIDWRERVIQLKLSSDRLKRSPTLEDFKPVSLQKSEQMAKGDRIWPYPWETIALVPGTYEETILLNPQEGTDDEHDYAKHSGDPHLRSTSEVGAYAVYTTDGESGHLLDLIVEDRMTWGIRYMVIDTGAMLPGKKFLISTSWIDRISWEDRSILLDVTMNAVKNAPPYDPRQAVNREYEERIYDYYGRPMYW